MFTGFSHPVAGGSGNMILKTFQSPTYVAGVSGWQITQDGDAEFNNVEARGQFYGTEFFMNDQGAFFYSGTPGPGNLIASITSSAGTDPYGNPFNAGFNLYNGTALAALVNNGSVPTLWFVPAGLVHLSINPQMFSFSVNSGDEDEQVVLVLTSGKESGNADAAMQLYSQSADGTVAPQVVWDFGGSGITILTPSGFEAKGWIQASAYGSGWEASGEGVSGFWFRPRLDAGTVEWMADVKTTSSSPSSTLCTIPAGCVPGTGMAGGAVTAGADSYAVSFQSGGSAQASVAASSGTRYTGTGFYPLAAP